MKQRYRMPIALAAFFGSDIQNIRGIVRVYHQIWLVSLLVVGGMEWKAMADFCSIFTTSYSKSHG